MRDFDLYIFDWLFLAFVHMGGVGVAILSFDPPGISFGDFTGYSGMDMKRDREG